MGRRAWRVWIAGLLGAVGLVGCSREAGGATATGGSVAVPTAGRTEEATETALPTPTAGFRDAFELNARLGRGVNLGNALEAPVEGEWGVVLREEYFELIAEAGFDAVRIPVRWSAHAAAEPPYAIDEGFFERVDWAIEQALARELLVVLNVHHYEALMEDPAGQRARFLAIWEQVGERYRDYPDALLFELLNEPTGALDGVRWNELLGEALEVVRGTNPERVVVVGPASWNSIDALGELVLPGDDERIIVTVHYYEPFAFTHQGAEWVDGSEAWLGTAWEGTAVERAAVEGDLDRAAAWAEEHGRPLYLGEFGAYSRADMASRVRWTEFVAREAEERGVSWAYWEFCAGFGVYNPLAGVWNEALLAALVP